MGLLICCVWFLIVSGLIVGGEMCLFRLLWFGYLFVWCWLVIDFAVAYYLFGIDWLVIIVLLVLAMIYYTVAFV